MRLLFEQGCSKLLLNGLVISLASSLALSACGKKDQSRPTEPLKPRQQQKKLEMPKVKYPAAIVFEGGTGQVGFDEFSKKDSKRQPKWRVYICLENTQTPITGQLELDLAKLEQPILAQWTNTETGEKTMEERLDKVVINYTYTTTLSDKPAENFGYAFGNAAFKATSVQDWKVLSGTPGVVKSQDSFFDLEIYEGSLSQLSFKPYKVKEQDVYVVEWLERFTYSSGEQSAHVIEACEKAGQPVVWQFGTEIKK